MAAVSRWGVGGIADRFGPTPAIAPLLFTGALGLAAIGLTADGVHDTAGRVLVMAGLLLAGVAYGGLQNLTLAQAFIAAGEPARSTVSIAWNLSFDAGTGLGAFATGAIATAISYPAAFGVLAVATGLVGGGWVRPGRLDGLIRTERPNFPRNGTFVPYWRGHRGAYRRRVDFTLSERSREMRKRLAAFMDECVYPAEAVYDRSRATSLDPHHIPPVVEDLKVEARSRGLWNLFLPSVCGLSNVEYAPLAELMGRSPVLAAEACNCSAPDTGNMELLHTFGTAEQQRRWLGPLLEGEIRSCFAMTEPDVASSDATNIATRIERDGDDLVITGRKWWITGAADPRCRVALVLGASDPDAEVHRRHSVVLVPLDTPGVILVRDLTVFGYHDHQGHCELRFEGARVPADSLLGPGRGGLRRRAEPASALDACTTACARSA